MPVKPTAHAKSRLSALGDRTRRSLVAAFAADTVTAAAGSPRVGAVLVVTDDYDLAGRLRALGADVVPDGVTDDLNASLVQASAEAERRWPGLAPTALCADLPALRIDDLTRALDAASQYQAAMVPDVSGEGTTMLAASSRATFRPRFGPGSRAAHLDEQVHEIAEVDVPTLRRDVDTPADLVEALELGVGRHTAEVTTGLRL